MLQLINLSLSFGGQDLFRSLNWHLRKGDRAGLVGPNGAGKTTLFRIITGQVERDGVAGEEHDELLARYGDLQHRFEELGGFRADAEVATVLTGLGFREDQFERRTETFSGGWQMRIALAKLLLQQPDILLLDEPTNHLDLDSLLWLEGYLKAYRGSIVIVSHD